MSNPNKKYQGAMEMGRNEVGEIIEEEIFSDKEKNRRMNRMMAHLDNAATECMVDMKMGFKNCEPKIGIFFYIEDDNGDIGFGSFFGDAKMEVVTKMAMEVNETTQGKTETVQ